MEDHTFKISRNPSDPHSGNGREEDRAEPEDELGVGGPKSRTELHPVRDPVRDSNSDA
jgi:hypothetical protein